MSAVALACAIVVLLAHRVRPRPPARTPAQLAVESGEPTPARARPSPRRRQRPLTAGEVAVWCDDLARATRSGVTLANAVREVTPPPSCAPLVDRVAHALDRGAPLGDALVVPGPVSPHVDLALVVLRACAVNGGPPSEPIDRAAAVLRSRQADADERRTQSAQARLSALVMTILPGAILAVLLLTSGAVRGVLASGAGFVLLTIGAMLNLLGWRWMRSIVSAP